MTVQRIAPGLDTAPRIAATLAVGVGIEATMLWRFGWSVPLAAYATFAAAATLISATDLAVRRIPNRVVYPTYLAGVALLAAASAHTGTWGSLVRAAIAMGALGAFYLVLGLAFPAGVGFGDIKWAGVTGLYLGWLDWSAVSTGTLVAFLGAASFVLVHRLASGASRRLAVAMAPFITAGTLVAILATK